jgi:hypothetical protein
MTVSVTPGRPKLSERDFQRQVIEVAQLHGWLVAHFRPALTSKGWRTPVEADGAGFPDLVLIQAGRLIVAELKAEGKSPSLPQLAWLEAFQRAGVETYIWRPSDFDAITETLGQ